MGRVLDAALLVVAFVAACSLAVALGGWLRGQVAMPVRVLIGAGAVVLLYLEPLWNGIGLALVAVGVATHLVLSRRAPNAAGPDDRS